MINPLSVVLLSHPRGAAQYATQRCAVNPAVNAQIAVQSGKFPQFPQALRQSIPALHSARETANPRLFLAGELAASRRPRSTQILGPDRPFGGCAFSSVFRPYLYL